MKGTPPVSCMCLTYGRPHLLEEAIESFLRQDYPGEKELIVLNDLAEQELVFDHPEVRIVNVPRRFRTLGEKRNAAAALASHDWLFVWDDDDIYLPWRISYSMEMVEDDRLFFKLPRALMLENGELSGPFSNVLHSSACFHRSLFDAIRGYAHMGSGQDHDIELRMKERGDTQLEFDDVPLEKLYYLYRWAGSGSFHLSGFGLDRLGEEGSGQRQVGEYVADRIMAGKLETGRIELKPRWNQDYHARFADYVAANGGDRDAVPVSAPRIARPARRRPEFTALYYSCSDRYPPMAEYCLDLLRKAVSENDGELVAVTWEPLSGVDRNIILEGGSRSHLTLYRQIMLGLEAAQSDIICLAEDDILYPSSHFALLIDRCRKNAGAVHYNQNIWHLSRVGFFEPAGGSTFFSTMGAARQHMRQAIAAKVAETEASPNKCPAWAEPRPEHWPVMFHHGPDPVIDIRASGNWTGQRQPDGRPVRQRLAPWGHASRYDFMFPELQGLSPARRAAGRLYLQLEDGHQRLAARLERLRVRLEQSTRAHRHSVARLRVRLDQSTRAHRHRVARLRDSLPAMPHIPRIDVSFREVASRGAIGEWLVHCADPEGPRTDPPRRALTPEAALTLVAEAQEHNVLAAVIRNLPALTQDPAFAAAREDAMARQRMLLGFAMMLRHHGNAVMQAAEGLEAAIIKGQVFARTIYPEPVLRAFTDIDILAAPEAIPHFSPILAAEGFVAADDDDDEARQEHQWVHRDNEVVAVEVHANLVHTPSMRRAVSLTYADIAEDPQAPAALLVIAVIHGGVGHHFQRLGHVVDICQAARYLRTAEDEAHFEKLVARSGARLAAITGLELAGHLFAEPRCREIARGIAPARHAAVARHLIGPSVITSAMNGSRFLHSWRRSVFRQLLKAGTGEGPSGRPAPSSNA